MLMAVQTMMKPSSQILTPVSDAITWPNGSTRSSTMWMQLIYPASAIFGHELPVQQLEMDWTIYG